MRIVSHVNRLHAGRATLPDGRKEPSAGFYLCSGSIVTSEG